jgi:plastocyanin
VKNRLAPILACFVLGLAVVGCGDDEDGAGDDVAPPTPVQTNGDGNGTGTGTATSDDAKAPKSLSVDVVDIDYEPNEATVAKGGTVTWTNTGDLTHTVTKESGPGADFDSGAMNSGDTFEQTFDTPGTIEYVCTIHPQQRGTLTVE